MFDAGAVFNEEGKKKKDRSRGDISTWQTLKQVIISAISVLARG